MGCLHDRANIEQLARLSMVISMLIRRAVGSDWKAYRPVTRDQLWAKSLRLRSHEYKYEHQSGFRFYSS